MELRTAMMELRLENPKNVYSSRYVVFTKHRRGTVGIRLYYDLGVEGDVFYDEKRFRQDQQIRSLQAKAVETASGETGIRNFRNYLASANSISRPLRLAIVGDRNTRRITKAVPLKGELITAEAFFDFAEMFMGRNGYSSRSCMIGSDTGVGFSIVLDNEIPEISTIIDGEDFLTNSIYLKWNPGEIELGHMNRGFHKFRNAAIQAMNTRASMQEQKYVSTFLEKFGLDAHKVEEVSPYRKELQEYTARGYDIDRNNAATTLASMTVWNLYNSVTAFASHNDIWPEEDGRRMAVCETAVKFLYHDRDIKNYIDIFA